MLKVTSHVLRHLTETDRGEIVNCESRILRVIHRKHTGEGRSKIGYLEPLYEFAHPHLLHHLLHEDLDEDT